MLSLILTSLQGCVEDKMEKSRATYASNLQDGWDENKIEKSFLSLPHNPDSVCQCYFLNVVFMLPFVLH